MARRLSIALLFLLTSALHAQPPAKDTCRVGIYVLSLYDIDYPKQSYSVDFWMWFLYANDSLAPTTTVEVTNAKNVTFESSDTEKKNGVNWGTQKCRAVVKQAWDVRNFPFDRQTLKIVLEDALADTTELIYIPDTANSYLSSKVRMEGWRIGAMRLVRESATYETSYGDPELNEGSTYPAVVAYIDVQRDGLGLFFKLFTGVYIAFAICMLVFFINASEIESRLSLSVGTLFAIVANKYIVDSQLPPTSQFTLVDQIHALSFLFIFLNIIASVISTGIYRRDSDRNAAAGIDDPNLDRKRSQRTDRIAFGVLLVAYVVVNTIVIVNAA